MQRPLLAVSLVAVLTASLSGAGPLFAPDRLERLDMWLDAVERHQPGETDSALIVIAGFSSTDLQNIWTHVQVLLSLAGNRVLDTFQVNAGVSLPARIEYTDGELLHLREVATRLDAPGAANRLAKRGALLHADIGMLASSLPAGGWDNTEAGPQLLELEMDDGEHRRTKLNAPHWELARTLLDNVTPDPALDNDVRLWYRATFAYLQGTERYDLLHAARAVQLFTDDDDILLQAGALHEVLGEARVQLAIHSLKLPRGVRLQVDDAQGERGRAQAYFERAVRMNPNLAEARLRLGRVLSLRGDQEQAIAQLERVRSRTQDTLLLYYANLFLGAAEEAKRRPVPARAAYERAVTLYPRAQSPHLGLSRLAMAAGREDEARREVEQAVRLPENAEGHDPWWTYHVASGRHTSALLAALYQRFSPTEQD